MTCCTSPSHGCPTPTHTGKNLYGSQVVPFTTADPTPPCSEVACVAIETTRLLNGEEYYITLSVTNALGLSTHVSQAFQHITGPPDEGLVFDVVAFRGGTYRDADVMIGSDPLTAVWEGLDHPFSPVTYSVAIGTTPGGTEVFPLTPVGGVQSYEFANLTLPAGSTYYILVWAEAATGATQAVSDGIHLLANETDEVTASATVLVEDQLSTSVVRALWDFPSLSPSLVSHYLVALYTAEGDDPLSTLSSRGTDTAAILSGLTLNPQTLYRVGVTACHLDGCLPVVFSEVFSVHTPLELVMIEGLYSPKANLTLSWRASGTSSVVTLQWTVGQDTYGGRILLPWQSVKDAGLNGSITVPANSLDSVVDPQIPTFITIRVAASSGLWTQQTEPLKWWVGGVVLAQGDIPEDRPVVRDILPRAHPAPAANSSSEVEFFADNITDVDYTPYSDQLAASWPTLRFTKYSWSVAEQPSFLSCDLAIACGETFLNNITASGLDLEHGHTYFICIRALPQDLIEVDTLPQLRQAVVVCSDGVLVLTSPPIPGRIAVVTNGAAPNVSSATLVQPSTSELHLQWDAFEVAVSTYHATALSHYEYALGTSPGAVDIVPFTNVGVSQEAMLTSLSLTPGLPYYATVRAVDLAGRSSRSSPASFRCDTTPPFVNWVRINSEWAYSLNREDDIIVFWSNIVERESRVTFVRVDLGSRRGASDIYQQGVYIYSTFLRIPALSLSLLSSFRHASFVWASITVSCV